MPSNDDSDVDFVEGERVEMLENDDVTWVGATITETMPIPGFSIIELTKDDGSAPLSVPFERIRKIRKETD